LLDDLSRLGRPFAEFWEATPIETTRAQRGGFYREALLGHWLWAALVGKSAPTAAMLLEVAPALWSDREEDEDDEVDRAERFRGLISGLPKSIL
jgi:hypothetical protein